MLLLLGKPRQLRASLRSGLMVDCERLVLALLPGKPRQLMASLRVSASPTPTLTSGYGSARIPSSPMQSHVIHAPWLIGGVPKGILRRNKILERPGGRF
jgi:hypothetical protein